MNRSKLSMTLLVLMIPAAVAVRALQAPRAAGPGDGYQALLKLFADFREFQKPPLSGGVPDYSAAAMAAGRPPNASTTRSSGPR
jgi:hypothetical protein